MDTIRMYAVTDVCIYPNVCMCVSTLSNNAAESLSDCLLKAYSFVLILSHRFSSPNSIRMVFIVNSECSVASMRLVICRFLLRWCICIFPFNSTFELIVSYTVRVYKVTAYANSLRHPNAFEWSLNRTSLVLSLYPLLTHGRLYHCLNFIQIMLTRFAYDSLNADKILSSAQWMRSIHFWIVFSFLFVLVVYIQIQKCKTKWRLLIDFYYFST